MRKNGMKLKIVWALLPNKLLFIRNTVVSDATRGALKREYQFDEKHVQLDHELSNTDAEKVQQT